MEEMEETMSRIPDEFPDDLVVDFKLAQLPRILEFREQGKYEKAVYQLWLRRNHESGWAEIKPKEGMDEAEFRKHLNALRNKGVTVKQRTHTDRTVHFYGKWELEMPPSAFARLDGYDKREIIRRLRREQA